MRVYATAAYASQTIDWQRQVRDLIDDANELLAPSLGARLEVETMALWEDAGDATSLEKTLEQLRAKDAGEGVDWVAGMRAGVVVIEKVIADSDCVFAQSARRPEPKAQRRPPVLPT